MHFHHCAANSGIRMDGGIRKAARVSAHALNLAGLQGIPHASETLVADTPQPRAGKGIGTCRKGTLR